MRKSVRVRIWRRAFQFSGRKSLLEAGRRLELLHLQGRAQDRRQVADVLGDEEVVLHEALDRAQAAALVVAQLLGEPRLHVERQHLLGAAAEEVQVAPDRPQEVLALAEGGHLVGLEDAGRNGGGAHALAVEILRQPVQRVQIAQAPFAVLDVGLDLVAALARRPMPRIALGHLRVDEAARGAGDDLVAEALLERGVELRIAMDETRIEQRRAHGDVGGAHLDALVDGARGVADLEAEIPQHVEDVLGDALSPGRLLVGEQKKQIDVGARRQQAAPVAARRHDGHALGIGWIGRPVDVRDRVVVEHANELVLKLRQPRRAAPAVAVALEPAARRLACARRRATSGARAAWRAPPQHSRGPGTPRSAPRAARADRSRGRLFGSLCPWRSECKAAFGAS